MTSKWKYKILKGPRCRNGTPKRCARVDPRTFSVFQHSRAAELSRRIPLIRPGCFQHSPILRIDLHSVGPGRLSSQVCWVRASERDRVITHTMFPVSPAKHCSLRGFPRKSLCKDWQPASSGPHRPLCSQCSSSSQTRNPSPARTSRWRDSFRSIRYEFLRF
jgi:hypothetical protein